MTEKEQLLTKEGYIEREEELDYLKTVRRKEMAEKIKEARSFGDLSENAEYDEAKNEQAQLEEQITKLENMLRNAKIIEEGIKDTDRVQVGSSIVVKDLEYGDQLDLVLVGTAEADPSKGKISNESPVGSACLGRKKGDILDVETPNGIIQYEIVEIKG